MLYGAEVRFTIKISEDILLYRRGSLFYIYCLLFVYIDGHNELSSGKRVREAEMVEDTVVVNIESDLDLGETKGRPVSTNLTSKLLSFVRSRSPS